MHNLFRYAALLLVVTSSLMFLTQCTSKPPVAEVSPSPTPSKMAASPVQVTEIKDQGLVPTEIVQQKTFDQCASASPFKAQAQFSQLSSEQAQKELVLSAEVGGEVGVSSVAKVILSLNFAR